MPTTRIAFASCMDAERSPDQPVWHALAALNPLPDALLLLGDLIYMDWGLNNHSAARWKQQHSQSPNETLAVFAAEMHRRYQLQWEVPSFRALLQALHAKGAQVVLCRDEHDLAWNNAYGAGGHEDVVPKPFLDISNRLFHQFAQRVTQPGGAPSYPGVNDAAPAPQWPTSLGGLPFLLLDERSHRTQREEPGASILGDDQMTLLKQQVEQATGLLIVAGSSPLRHDYLLAEQGWWAQADAKKAPGKADRAYPEYAQFVAAAKEAQRPVLYLAGDIHRNAYGGPVEAGATVVQALSSGAGLGRLLFRRFPGAFAWVDVQGTAQDCRVELNFQTGTERDHVPALEVKAGRWQTPLVEGECTRVTSLAEKLKATATALQDDGPLRVLCYRERGKALRFQDELSPFIEDVDEETFTDALPANVNHPVVLSDFRDAPEPVIVSAQGERQLKVQRFRGAGEQNARASKLVQDAFVLAEARQQPAVVLWIHGFNKTFTASLQQAGELRDRFPVQPVLYSWPTGSEGSLLGLLGGYTAARRNAALGLKGLSAALIHFGQMATQFKQRGVKAVVVARSTGALALAEAMTGGNGSNLRVFMADVSRFILSAPAVGIKGHGGWVSQLPGSVCITMNRRDHTLRYADWLHWGTLLGRAALDDPDLDAAPRALYLDYTGAGMVDQAHDYLLRRLGPGLDTLNDALVSGAPVTAALAAAAGVRTLGPMG